MKQKVRIEMYHGDVCYAHRDFNSFQAVVNYVNCAYYNICVKGESYRISVIKEKEDVGKEQKVDSDYIGGD